MEKTEYRAIKVGFMEYHLQFRVMVKWRLWWATRWIEKWRTVPSKKAKIIDFVTKDNADDVCNAGYGIYQLSERKPEDFQWFMNRYPDVQMYFDELNKERQEWLNRQQKDSEKPNIVNFK